MIAKNCSKQQLERALDYVNGRYYRDNIKFKRLDCLNGTGDRWRFTLTVNSSRGPGSRTSAGVLHPERRLAAACWHAHGNFFEALFRIAPAAEIKTGRMTITAEGGNWTDYNVGSIAYPRYFSECCDCN